MTDDGGLLRSLKDSSLRYFLRSSVPSVSPRPSLSLHSPLRGREERTTEGVSDERSTRSGEGTGLTTLLSVPSSLSFIIYSPGSFPFPLSFRYATRLRLTGVDRKGNEPRAGGNRGREVVKGLGGAGCD